MIAIKAIGAEIAAVMINVCVGLFWVVSAMVMMMLSIRVTIKITIIAIKRVVIKSAIFITTLRVK